MLFALALGTVLAALMATMVIAQREAEAAFTEKVVFESNRTTGPGVNNPTGDFEIFRMNPDGTGVRQLTTNKVNDFGPSLSPDKTKVAYHTYNKQTSNPEGDSEIYRLNASDGLGKKNLTNNGTGVEDNIPQYSPDGNTIAYESKGLQNSNREGDSEIYRLSSLDGSAKKNLTNNGADVFDGVYPD
jgi:Tol biopolymer transport system component